MFRRRAEQYIHLSGANITLAKRASTQKLPCRRGQPVADYYKVICRPIFLQTNFTLEKKSRKQIKSNGQMQNNKNTEKMN